MQDALHHPYELGYVDEWDGLCFRVTRQTMTLDEIAYYDDPPAWQEWDWKELADLDLDDVLGEAAGFRGEEWAERAEEWIATGVFPPVVVVAGERAAGERLAWATLGDGRGRYSLANGLGIAELPVILLEEDPAGTVCVEVRENDEGYEYLHFWERR
jgi:hypothetical protein